MKELTKKDLNALTDDERAFYHLALKRYRADADWLAFEDLAFGMRSPIYQRQRSHLDVLQHPLYIALREMWLDLGVKQGMIAPSKKKEKGDAPRRSAARSGKTAQRRDGKDKRHVASANSPADKRLPKSRG